MEQKFKLGDEVHCEFVGKIIKVSLENNKVVYTLTGAPIYAISIPEENLTPLPTPEDLK